MVSGRFKKDSQGPRVLCRVLKIRRGLKGFREFHVSQESGEGIPESQEGSMGPWGLEGRGKVPEDHKVKFSFSIIRKYSMPFCLISKNFHPR